MSDAILKRRAQDAEISYLEGWLAAYALLTIPQAEAEARARTAAGIQRGFAERLTDLRVAVGLADGG